MAALLLALADSVLLTLIMAINLFSTGSLTTVAFASFGQSVERNVASLSVAERAKSCSSALSSTDSTPPIVETRYDTVGEL